MSATAWSRCRETARAAALAVARGGRGLGRAGLPAGLLALSTLQPASHAATPAVPAPSAAASGAAGAASAAGAAGAVGEAPTEAIIVGLLLNGTLVADSQMVRRELQGAKAQVWVPEREAAAWRVAVAARPLRVFDGVPHRALCRLRDQCFYDESTALLTIVVDNADLLPLHVGGTGLTYQPPSDDQASGMYLNYDLSAWQMRRPGVAALAEGKVYSPSGHGVFRLGGLYATGRRQTTLLQGLWQVDRPDQGISVQAGSIVVPDTVLGAGMPLLGLRMGSNVQLRPDLDRTLRPEAMGLADKPQRTDIFVDGQFRQTANVPYGPYRVEVDSHNPGRGSLDLLTTDQSGVQTRMVVPYYVAPVMLAPGVRDWTLDGGLLGNDTSKISRNSPLALNAGLRQGINSWLTAQGQALVASGGLRLAGGADMLNVRLGVSSVGAVLQHTATQGSGLWLSLGHDYTSRDFSASFKVEQLMGGCDARAAGTDAIADRLWRPCNRLLATLGGSFTDRWSYSASADGQQDEQGKRGQLLALGLRQQVGARSQMSVTLQHQVLTGARTSTALLLTWSQPLGTSQTGQVSTVQRTGYRPEVQWATQSTPQSDDPETQRYRTYGAVGEHSQVGGGWTNRGATADWRADGWASDKDTSISGGVSGALGYTGGRFFTSRRIDDAFVIVDAGLPNLPVLLDNRVVGHTNAQGWAVVTEARAFQANNIGVDATALPIQYSLPLDQQNVTPGGGAGVLARFDISDGGVQIAVQDPTGKRLPTGSTVHVSTQRLPTAVTSDGSIFLERSDREAEVIIEWKGQSCRFTYNPQRDSVAYRCATS